MSTEREDGRQEAEGQRARGRDLEARSDRRWQDRAVAEVASHRVEEAGPLDTSMLVCLGGAGEAERGSRDGSIGLVTSREKARRGSGQVDADLESRGEGVS